MATRVRRYKGLVSNLAGLLLVGVLIAGPSVAWVWNLVQLVSCDWDGKGNWKGEIVHSIGLIPYASLVTVWFADK